MFFGLLTINLLAHTKLKAYRQPLLFIVNGVTATIAHYIAFLFAFDLMGDGHAGLANGFGAVIGIILSFLGNSIFVFQANPKNKFKQSVKFLVTYLLLALLCALAMYVWADVHNLNHHLGFSIALVLQTTLSYLANKHFVFNRPV